MEIAGLVPPQPLITRAQASEGSSSCMAGEVQRERWGN
jgi:hypothetical protein